MIRFIIGGILRRLVEEEEGREIGIWRYRCVFVHFGYPREVAGAFHIVSMLGFYSMADTRHYAMSRNKSLSLGRGLARRLWHG